MTDFFKAVVEATAHLVDGPEWCRRGWLGEYRVFDQCAADSIDEARKLMATWYSHAPTGKYSPWLPAIAALRDAKFWKDRNQPSMFGAEP